MSKKIEISKDTLMKIVKYYIEENHSQKDTCDKFKISGTKLRNVLNENGFKKTSKYVENPKEHKEKGKYENNLKCLECGKNDVINLYQHIKILHKMTKDEYINKYNYNGKFMATPDKDLKIKMGTTNKGKPAWNKGLGLEDERIQKIVNTRKERDNYKMTEEQKKKISNTLLNKNIDENKWKNSNIISSKDNLLKWSNEFLNTHKYKPMYSNLASLVGCSYHTAERYIKKYNLENNFKIYDYGMTEQSIEDFIKTLDITYIKHDRTEIAPQELDFYFPEHKVAIEFNDIASHNSTIGFMNSEPKSKNYHIDKSKRCEHSGIRLIHIWEYEWNDKRQRPILENIIKNALGVNDKKIYARKCKIEVKESSKMKQFFNDNNIQGFRGGKFAVCLMYENEVVMSYMMGNAYFGKGKYDWEVIRRCY